MTKFINKSFSVALGLDEKGRANYDRIFKPRRRRKKEKDDTARIQEAIDKAMAPGVGGGEVYFPVGTYKVAALKPAKKPRAKKAAK